ncbi:VOC family protein [Nocardioides nitrophenolicus]|uniref:VOC family protein n=1 Tax=Nocardioides nitrophenolicus TaxID=60489 RepID=UPI00195CABBD|nr:VOC family protein [Nocardioides nitrophenolicus]MBM7519446.1 catechol 2,3-dioxygenase-like lactoylglutathione lyase family enzyme [Nocardioides nitrophenolicus]
MGYPRLRSTVLDTTDVPTLAEFYRRLLGWSYPEGYDIDEFTDWRSIVGPSGERLSFQQVDELAPTTWPSPEVPQQLHLDFQVDGHDELDEGHRRALELGAVLRLDRSEDPEEPLRVYADPAGHTFCLFTH